jgi:hypothetical protein
MTIMNDKAVWERGLKLFTCNLMLLNFVVTIYLEKRFKKKLTKKDVRSYLYVISLFDVGKFGKRETTKCLFRRRW